MITHSEDLDGIASAVMLRLKYKMPLSNLFFADHSTKTLDYAFDGVERRAKPGDLIFITDLSPDTSTVAYLKRRVLKLKKRGCTFIWLDHHPWAKDNSELARLCYIAVFGESSTCATEIAQKALNLHGSYAKRLADIVHVSDFALMPRSKAEATLLRNYDRALVYCNTLPIKRTNSGLRSVVREIGSGRIRNRLVDSAAGKLEKMSSINTAAMLRDLRYIRNSIAVGFSGSEIFSDEAKEKMFAQSRKDIVIHIDCDRRTASMRSKSKDISGLGSAMGGGGHPHAAGFPLNESYDLKKENGRKRLLSDIEKAAVKLGIV